MSDLKLDTDGDLAIEEFDLVFVSDEDEIAQRLRIRLQTFLGEYYLDVNHGVPYIQTIFKKGTSTNLIDAIFRQQILATEGVAELLDFDLSLDPGLRELSVDFIAKTTSGSTVEVSI